MQNFTNDTISLGVQFPNEMIQKAKNKPSFLQKMVSLHIHCLPSRLEKI